MGGTQLIAAANEVFQTTIGVVGGRLNALNRQSQSGAVGDGLLFIVGQRPVGLREVRFTVDPNRCLREPLFEFFSLANETTRSDEAQPFHDGMLGHVTVPPHDVDQVAVLVGDGCSLPVVPQPHGEPRRR